MSRFFLSAEVPLIETNDATRTLVLKMRWKTNKIIVCWSPNVYMGQHTRVTAEVFRWRSVRHSATHSACVCVCVHASRMQQRLYCTHTLRPCDLVAAGLSVQEVEGQTERKSWPSPSLPLSLHPSFSPLVPLMNDGKNFLTPTRLADGCCSFPLISSSFFFCCLTPSDSGDVDPLIWIPSSAETLFIFHLCIKGSFEKGRGMGGGVKNNAHDSSEKRQFSIFFSCCLLRFRMEGLRREGGRSTLSSWIETLTLTGCLSFELI